MSHLRRVLPSPKEQPKEPVIKRPRGRPKKTSFTPEELALAEAKKEAIRKGLVKGPGRPRKQPLLDIADDGETTLNMDSLISVLLKNKDLSNTFAKMQVLIKRTLYETIIENLDRDEITRKLNEVRVNYKEMRKRVNDVLDVEESDAENDEKQDAAPKETHGAKQPVKQPLKKPGLTVKIPPKQMREDNLGSPKVPPKLNLKIAAKIQKEDAEESQEDEDSDLEETEPEVVTDEETEPEESEYSSDD